jgi:hypothetical protein
MTNIPSRVYLLAVMAALTTAPIAMADVIYISQKRSVSIGNQGIAWKYEEAPDFGPFVASIMADPPYGDYAKASQASTLNPKSIVAKGACSGGKSSGAFQGFGTSLLSVKFWVGKPTPWALKGFLEYTCNYSLSISLSGPGVNISIVNPPGGVCGAPKTYWPLDMSDALQPGMYTFSVSAGAAGGSSPTNNWGSVLYDLILDFTEPCLPDCDADGTLTIDDFICFQTYFAMGNSYADCDADGTLTIDDFICFQTFFAIGC